ncbi:MAG: aminoglycoside phosphotransferase [Porticoccaceae bacterium]|nr:aminoglycoside phosphotransferase [Porticoccaceae bacterium]
MDMNSPYRPRREKLPIALDQVTPEWLTRVLQLRFPDLEVRSFAFIEVNNTHTTKLRLSLDLNEAGIAMGFPHNVCLKANWSGSPLSSGAGICELEARFYRYFRDQLAIPAPVAYYADWDEDRFNQGLVIMEDLVDAGVSFSSTNDPINADEAARSIEGLAVMHASCWGNDILDDHPWLKVAMSADCSDPNMYHSLEEHMRHNNQLPRRRAVLPGWFLSQPERLSRAYDALAAHEVAKPGPRTLIHGDAHLGNSYVTPGGERRWLDWQIVRRGTPWRELNYFLISAMTIEERRGNERHLLQHYMDLMASKGCEMPDSESAWNEYRLWDIYGLASFNGSRDEWGPENAIFAGVERFSAAIQDHDSLSLMAAISGRSFW